jgi:Ankyrin repeats (3 copies)
MPFPFLEQVKLRITRVLAQVNRRLTQFALPILLGMVLGAIAGIPFGSMGKLVGGAVGGTVNGYLAWRQMTAAKIASQGLSALIGILNGLMVTALYWASVCRSLPTWPPIASFSLGWLLGVIVLAVMLAIAYDWAKRSRPAAWFAGLIWVFLFICTGFFLPIPSSLGFILAALLPNLILNGSIPFYGDAPAKRWLTKHKVVLSRQMALIFFCGQLMLSFGSAYIPFLHPLVKAAEGGDLARVEMLRLTEPDRQLAGVALLQAIDHKKLTVAKALLTSGAAVNGRNFYGDTPLTLAIFATGFSKQHICQPEYENLAIGLIQKGAEVNVRGGFWGNAPLIQAANNECGKLVKALLQARADVNTRNDLGETALWRTNNDIRKMLIGAGIDLNAMSYSLPLHGKSGRTALMYAIATAPANPKSFLNTVNLLIAAGADVTAKSAEGETALSLAGALNHSELIKILQRSGARG